MNVIPITLLQFFRKKSVVLVTYIIFFCKSLKLHNDKESSMVLTALSFAGINRYQLCL